MPVSVYLGFCQSLNEFRQNLGNIDGVYGFMLSALLKTRITCCREGVWEWQRRPGRRRRKEEGVFPIRSPKPMLGQVMVMIFPIKSRKLMPDQVILSTFNVMTDLENIQTLEKKLFATNFLQMWESEHWKLPSKRGRRKSRRRSRSWRRRKRRRSNPVRKKRRWEVGSCLRSNRTKPLQALPPRWE